MLLSLPIVAATPSWPFSLLPAIVMVASAALAGWLPPGQQWRNAILHFAAGVARLLGLST